MTSLDRIKLLLDPMDAEEAMAVIVACMAHVAAKFPNPFSAFSRMRDEAASLHLKRTQYRGRR